MSRARRSWPLVAPLLSLVALAFGTSCTKTEPPGAKGSSDAIEIRESRSAVSVPPPSDGPFPGVDFVGITKVNLRSNAWVGGSIAVVEADPSPTARELTLGTDASLYANAWANRIQLNAGATIYFDAGTNQKFGSGWILGNQDTVDIPLGITLPSTPQVTPGTTNLTVPRNDYLDLEPGAYGTVTFQAPSDIWSPGGILSLAGGTYVFESVAMSRNSAIHCESTCEVNVVQPFRIVAGASVQHTSTGSSAFILRIHSADVSGTPAFRALGDSWMAAYLHVPNGQARFLSGATAVGRVVAQTIDIAGSVSIGGCSTQDLTCDGADDDCDWELDDDVPTLPSQCGVGACARVGTVSCDDATLVDTCVPGAPGPNDVSCNGVDDDCDGQVDEDYVGEQQTCGQGACQRSGTTACVQGTVEGGCVPGAPASEDASCNGVDDDCNGQVDEDFAPQASACGQGECARTGVVTCSQGQTADSCTPGAAAPTDATCDGRDDDCDGQIDEDFAAAPTSCGVGACARSGSQACVNGQPQDSCQAGSPAANDSLCNGQDDDCDGQVDEDFVGHATSCGLGACQRTGTTSCQEGHVVDSCAPGQGATADTSCDGIDEDCDGAIDEDYVSRSTECGAGSCSASGVTSCLNGQETDSCVGGAGTGTADTTCDGVDDDCDGQIDEDFVAAASQCGTGECRRTGQITCASGQLQNSCSPGGPAPNDATCDGLDDDCDGATDEDFVPVATSCGLGACQSAGQTSCVNAQVVDSCHAGAAASSDVSCDGVDSDCDGSVDEDYVGHPTSCGVGACARQGSTLCNQGQEVDSCQPAAPAALDATCDGVDDDCNGAVDEDYVATPSQCGVGACARAGLKSCSGGQVTDSCVPGAAASGDAACDGIDADCDGETDEDYSGNVTSCGVGACAAQGQEVCVLGQVEDTCRTGQPGAGDLTCDGQDDDCDGEVDEDFFPIVAHCGTGACVRTGETTCVLGSLVVDCTPGAPASADALCNGADDDCDGEVDEDFVAGSTTCGVGACARTGTSSCVEGVTEDSCAPGPPGPDDALCDGVDSDCDGLVDEDYAPTATSCGAGACTAAGTLSCSGGQVVDSCSAGNGAASDSICNGIDDDCDGLRDEDYTSRSTVCGVGACTAQGTTSCVAGGEQDSCAPGAAAPDDSVCNGVDDDCDGQTDEDYAATDTTCGVGACSSQGSLSCLGGQETNSCVPGSALGPDSTCNGVDDDCDGTADEDYVPALVACGVGACASTGTTSCEGGVVQSSCEPGDPAAADDDCDGVDDDCDGASDEDYIARPVSCGVGACAATGVTRCSLGQEDNDCTPLPPAADDASCDGIDADCDGSIDEDYVPAATTCGVGACAAEGQTSCVAGVVQNGCTPGGPAANDATCNGVDDDCNGAIDEDYVSVGTSCGTGACAAQGATQCVEGAVQNSCEPSAAAANDASCNGVDDDCDGATDEDFVPSATSCGVGVCQATGETRCENGTITSLCTPSQPAPSDTTCDGRDDDCDGATDEEYQAAVSECGVGACRRTGLSSCEAGQVSTNCSPGQAAPTDTSCNGVDDDCDGASDEDFVVVSSSCGVGACSRTGQLSCQTGQVVDDCTAGFPGMNDSSCDGVDNDCDGATDEEFVGLPVQCGVGACERSGVTRCEGGHASPDCTPGQPASNDASCNGIDDNCNGQVDEGFSTRCNGDAVESCASGIVLTAPCTDGNACNGVESCLAAACRPGTPPDLEDGNPCTVGACDAMSGVVQTPAALGVNCGSGRSCDGAGRCLAAPVITAEPADQSVAAGQPLTLTVTATGELLTYQWFKAGQPLAQARTATLSVLAASASDAASYQVVVQNAAGLVTSRAAAVTVGDSLGPTLDLLTPPLVTTQDDLFVVTGRVSDAGSGVAELWVESSQLPGVRLTGIIAADGGFTVSVPLGPGANTLQVRARDQADNITPAQIIATLTISERPRIQISEPVAGFVSVTDTVTVRGVVRTTLSPDKLRIELGGAVFLPTGAPPEYAFTFPGVRLSPGQNQLIVGAVTPTMTVTESRLVYYGAPEDVAPGQAPDIRVFGVRDVVYEDAPSHEFAGTVSAATCVASLKINGQPVAIQGTGTNVSFGGSLPVPLDGTPLTVLMEAIDCQGRSSSLQYRVVFDGTPPGLVLSVATAPTVVLVSTTPYSISGTVTEKNLASISVNQQSVGAVPTGADSWDFAFELPLVVGEPVLHRLVVQDTSGNRTERDILIGLDSSLNIEVLSPSSGQKIVSSANPASVEFQVRVPGIRPGDTVVGRVDGGESFALAGGGDVRSGGTAVPADGATHEAVISVLASDGASAAQAGVRFTVIDANTLPIELVSVDPARDAENVEANQPITVVFNRPIDFEELTLEVRETGHAFVYSPPPAGADMSTLSRREIVEVTRSDEVVPGNLGPVPDEKTFVFYPSREFLFSSEVRVIGRYQGNEVFSTRFRVRPEPTLMEGVVLNQFAEPVSGVEVKLETGQVARTDASGNFAFGFGTFASAIDGGRQVLWVNADGDQPRFGRLELFVSPTAGRRMRMEQLYIPQFSVNEPQRAVSAGERILLAGGALELDLTNAAVVFDDGAVSGGMHSQVVGGAYISAPSDTRVFPFFGHLQVPLGVEVVGELTVKIRVPHPDVSATAPRITGYALLVGMDPASRTLVPVGVVWPNPETKTFESRGHVALELLDVVAVAAPAVSQDTLASYASGEISLEQLRGAVRAQ